MKANTLMTLAAAAALLCGADAQANLNNQAGDYEVQVLMGGSPARTYYHGSETYVLGHEGERYTLRVHNRSGRRVEAVVSVDGRDVIDGRPADYRNKRGYIVAPYSSVDIEGWRVNAGRVAAFRFSDVPSSYAGRTGGTRDVGVIGVAVFPERVQEQPLYIPRPPPPRPPYYYDRDDELSRRESAPAPSASPGKAGDSGSWGPPAAEKKARAAEPGIAGGYGRVMPTPRPGLGTGFGEAVDSPSREVSFTRQNGYSPQVVLGLRYNDREGLLAIGIPVDGYRPYWDDARLRRTAEPFPVNNRSYAPPPPGWNGY